MVTKNQQQELAHEFGHEMGLPHPSGRLEGTPEDYDADKGSLMGRGNEVRAYDIRDIFKGELMPYKDCKYIMEKDNTYIERPGQ